MYLVDTNVIFAASPNRPAPAELVEWMDAQSASLFLSVVTIAEVEDGIAKLRREKATRRSRDLAHWLDAVLHLYGDRILGFDMPTARIAGQLSDRAHGQGHAPGFADIVIAATARQHALTILSRSAKHFVPLGVAVLDPFGELPPS
ncbi:VapC toxin family PIN domain ribonuclease [Bradyrhizobium genosp. SA-3]|uniref:type II toxin-antitoxin system VapC family toxin n=1 Tax=Bradyrhizobium genosp. SA-3 TaxID=508868 RepID=UPI001028A335|nr:type II toxin-antitoxin system VapC family toxin [Bradyrhizobium genosp. SA-3]RZM94775.1 VapC toxin family PIN domain ribonuclease [Bradyrhizobium genosp. SA-3]